MVKLADNYFITGPEIQKRRNPDGISDGNGLNQTNRSLDLERDVVLFVTKRNNKYER